MGDNPRLFKTFSGVFKHKHGIDIRWFTNCRIEDHLYNHLQNWHLNSQMIIYCVCICMYKRYACAYLSHLLKVSGRSLACSNNLVMNQLFNRKHIFEKNDGTENKSIYQRAVVDSSNCEKNGVLPTQSALSMCKSFSKHNSLYKVDTSMVCCMVSTSDVSGKQI